MGIAMKRCALVMCVLGDLVYIPVFCKFRCLKTSLIIQKISILRHHCLALDTIFAL